MNRCVILCAGPVEDAAALAALLRPSDEIIAADGGCRLAAALGVRPWVIVSDFDSSAMPADEKEVDVVRLPVRKDVTDAAAAVDYGWAAGYREFLLLGGTGGRLDHEYANYQLLVQLAQRGGHGVLADSRNRVEAVCRSPVWPEPMPGWKLSLFAFGGPVTGLTIQNASYTLSDYTLQPADPLCVSNEAAADCTITFDSGTLLLFRTKD